MACAFACHRQAGLGVALIWFDTTFVSPFETRSHADAACEGVSIIHIRQGKTSSSNSNESRNKGDEAADVLEFYKLL